MKSKMTARKAQFLNYSRDGIKLRSITFKNRHKYSRKRKYKGDGDFGSISLIFCLNMVQLR